LAIIIKQQSERGRGHDWKVEKEGSEKEENSERDACFVILCFVVYKL